MSGVPAASGDRDLLKRLVEIFDALRCLNLMGHIDEALVALGITQRWSF